MRIRESDMRRVILVTGVSSGIGRCVAEHLGTNGQIVYGASRSKVESPHFRWIEMDITSEESVNEVIEQLIAEQGRLDVLINNAGNGIAGSIEETDIDDARAQFETNFFGTVRVTQAALTKMRAQHSGLILNISSLAGKISLPFQAFYSSSKFALEGFADALRHEVAPFNIRVVNILPGDFATNFTANRQVSPRSTNPQSPYSEQFSSMMQRVEFDELNGANPILIAKLAQKVISQRNPKGRYVTGSFAQKSSLILKSVLPEKMFEHTLRAYYGLKKF